jgi:hypothetical protein
VNSELIRVAIALVGSSIASYYDVFNNRNVPTIFSYSLIAIGLLLNVLTADTGFLIGSLGIVALIFIFGYLIYRMGQIGGADVLLFVAIALLLPDAPPSLLQPANLPFRYPTILSIFVLSGILAIFGISLKYIPRVFKDIIKGEKIEVSGIQFFLSLTLAFVYIMFMVIVNSMLPLSTMAIAVLIITIVCSLFLSMFRAHIADRYMIRSVRIGEIDEEDVLALEKIDASIVSEFNLKKVLTKGEIEKLKKIKKMKVFPVYKNMPAFMPYILIALILILIFGNPIAYVFWVG